MCRRFSRFGPTSSLFTLFLRERCLQLCNFRETSFEAYSYWRNHIQARWNGRRWSDSILSQGLLCQVVFGVLDVASGFGSRGKNVWNKRTVIVNWLWVFMPHYLNHLVGRNSTVLRFLKFFWHCDLFCLRFAPLVSFMILFNLFIPIGCSLKSFCFKVIYTQIKTWILS